MTEPSRIYTARLIGATCALPEEIQRWLFRALTSGWFSIEAGAYETDKAMCPIAAAAAMAGIWVEGAMAAGNPSWGDATGPSLEVEEFSAYFDLDAEERGVDAALRTVIWTLRGALDRYKTLPEVAREIVEILDGREAVIVSLRPH